MDWQDLNSYFSEFPTGTVGELFTEAKRPFEPLEGLKTAIEKHFEAFQSSGSLKTEPDIILNSDGSFREGGYFITKSHILEQDFVDTKLKIAIAKGAFVEAGATIKNHTIIGTGTEIRQGAYLRGFLYIGPNCVAGHTTEMKNSILIKHVEAGHFSYIGDSILGSNINLGAGTKISNLEFRTLSQKENVEFPEMSMHLGGKKLPIGLNKLGAIVGDGFEAGCNSVIAPMAFIMKECWLYPNQTLLKGVYPVGTKIKGIESGLQSRI